MKNLKGTKNITMSNLRRLIKESSEVSKRYKSEVMADLVSFIEAMGDNNGWTTKAEYRRNRDKIRDEAFESDDVTGNASGSYTFSAYRAEENLTHAWRLLKDAMDAFADDRNPLDLGPEACDSIIRCYLLDQVLDKAIEDAAHGLPENEDDK